MMITIQNAEQPASPRRIFALLLLFRWLSLIAPLAAWLLALDGTLLLALAVATAVNSLISFFSTQLNRALRHQAWLLLADFVLVAWLIAYSGGWRSPFYLYALNPLLIAAFFFGLRGALTAVFAFLPLYITALLLASTLTNEPINWLMSVTAIVGLYLISGTFGYAANLVSHLRQTRDDLLLSQRERNVLHELTVSLQSAADVEEIQEKALEAVTVELGFQKAIIGLVDPGNHVITSWLARVREGSVTDDVKPIHTARIPLTAVGGPVAQALLTRQPIHAAHDPGAAESWLNHFFGTANYAIFPLLLREHEVGVLLVDVGDEEEAVLTEDGRFASLQATAAQAAVAIGTTMLCINRAQQIAVHEERIRIAQDLHDNVSQSLFGIVYMLDGSLKLLPEQPEIAKPELERALETAEQIRAEIRHSILDIWPTELSAERFTADLHKYAQTACSLESLQLKFDVRGDFAALSPQARRSLYRIAQEALANIGRHAAANAARVCVDVENGRAKLSVRDDGQGFDLQTALGREYGREHFGLRGIQERAKSLNGECHIFSQPNEGTSIIVDIPING